MGALGAIMDTLTPEQRRLAMSRVKSKNTSIELLLRKALWRLGYRYRINYSKLPGSPDIAITKHKIAIFCDGEFFHGHNWEEKKDKLDTNKEFWIKKIERNMERDDYVNKKLLAMGWTVIRFWGNEIKKELPACINEVQELILAQIIENAEDYFEIKN